ncbi:MAG: Asp23/Gls24 family envelope stress response protein [Dehalococcoidia bacterium]|nr:Asp23/Gls24 family envelope stress response protein [Dehalococcoidia bacterium]
MAEKVRDTSEPDGLQTEGQLNDAATGAPTRSRPAGRFAKGEANPPEGGMYREGGPGELSVASGAMVMGHLTIRELEMMGKIEELRRLDEIPVGGMTNIQPEVIGAIAGVATQSVDGVASLGTTSLRRTLSERLGGAERRARGVEVEVGTREAILDISVRIAYGHSIPTVVAAVRRAVAANLLALCGLVAKEINVRVVGMEFPDRMPGRVE